MTLHLQTAPDRTATVAWMHHARRTPLPALLALLLLTLIPIGAGVADAASGRWAANCTASVRAGPNTYAVRRARIPRNTAVVVEGTVKGGWYATPCGKSVSGRTWLVITAIGGRSVQSLYGVSKVYSASGLFHSVPGPILIRGPIYGVDVSQWNGPIDFRTVRASGREFVVARATVGQLTTDTAYARNRAGALAAGLAFTAYHYAHPDRARGDAIKEADHFLAVAQLRHGMLVPALDLESGSRLGPTRLEAWVKAWVTRVYSRLHVKPMIYVTQSFWTSYVGDTTWFAENGYRVLWVAHWGVPQPKVPARAWDGAAWTLWQYSDCGKVPGISSKCVDLDRFRGTDLASITWK